MKSTSQPLPSGAGRACNTFALFTFCFLFLLDRWAQYCESNGQYDDALEFYERAKGVSVSCPLLVVSSMALFFQRTERMTRERQAET